MYGHCKENPQLKCNKKPGDDKCALGLDNKHCRTDRSKRDVAQEKKMRLIDYPLYLIYDFIVRSSIYLKNLVIASNECI